MTKSTLNQSEYTRLFLCAAGIDEQKNTIDVGSFWWQTVNPNHLRLSVNGVSFIKKHTKIPIYTIYIAHQLLSTHLIMLSRVKLGPYYLHTKEKNSAMMLINDEAATMLTLHAGNLGQYLENLKEQS